MAEKIGVVVESASDGWARVMTDRTGGCGGCHSGSGGCRSCLAGATLESRAANPVGARTGDLVRLSLPAASVYTGAALLYLLPIAALLIGAFGGLWLGTLAGWSDAAGSVSGALVGLVTASWALVRIGRNPRMVRRMTPDITAVVQRAGDLPQPVTGACCR